MGTFKAKTRGLKAWQRTQKRMRTTRPVVAELYSNATTTAILDREEDRGRDVVFFDAAEQSKGAAALATGVEGVISGRGSMLSGARKLGAYMVATVRRHIEEGKASRGKVRPVTERTAKAKVKATGRANLPALVRTGRLLASFASRAREGR